MGVAVAAVLDPASSGRRLPVAVSSPITGFRVIRVRRHRPVVPEKSKHIIHASHIPHEALQIVHIVVDEYDILDDVPQLRR